MSETEFARAERYWRETCQLTERLTAAEKRLKWAEGLLSSAVVLVCYASCAAELEGDDFSDTVKNANAWLSDYKKGPVE